MCTDDFSLVYILVHLYRQKCQRQWQILHIIDLILFKGNEQEWKIFKLVRLQNTKSAAPLEGALFKDCQQ